MARLINVTEVKRLALAVSQQQRNGKFTRVSKQFLDRIESKVSVAIAYEVGTHPSIGKTLK